MYFSTVTTELMVIHLEQTHLNLYCVEHLFIMKPHVSCMWDPQHDRLLTNEGLNSTLLFYLWNFNVSISKPPCKLQQVTLVKRTYILHFSFPLLDNSYNFIAIVKDMDYPTMGVC